MFFIILRGLGSHAFSLLSASFMNGCFDISQAFLSDRRPSSALFSQRQAIDQLLLTPCYSWNHRMLGQSRQHYVVQLHVAPLFFGFLPVRPLHNSGKIVPFELSANHRPLPPARSKRIHRENPFNACHCCSLLPKHSPFVKY